MIKFPYFLLFAVIAFNLTAFAIILQMDWLVFKALIYKIIAWTCSAGAWALVFAYRNE
jgi:hypothetical protein